MTSEPRGARPAALVGLGTLALFWLLVLVGGWLQPGYRASRDYVSALASEGARSPAVGIAALLAFGTAYLACAVVLERWVGTRAGAVLLVAAGLATWVVAAARIHCPGGAAYCGLTRPDGALAVDAGGRFGPHLHGWGVAVSYTFVAVAMLWLAILWRRRRHPLRAWASAGALVASLATVPFWLSADSPGLAQRVWLGILSAWVVLICARPLLDDREGTP